MVTNAAQPIWQVAEPIPLPQVDNSGGDIRQRILSAAARRWIVRSSARSAESNDKPAGTSLVYQENPSKVIIFPKFEPVRGRPSECFAALQEWEGVVTAISDASFSAHLYNITNGTATVEELAEFLIKDLDDAQRAALRPGAIFRWAIGFTKKDSGRQTKTSVIYFRKTSRRPTEFLMPIFCDSN